MHLCEMCGIMCKSPSSLKTHIRTHTGSKPYMCMWCGAKFAQKNALVRHVEVKHLNIKKYKCDICKLDVGSRTHLTVHMRSHTGEKPFLCIYCDKPFSRKDAMKRHVKTVHAQL